MDDQYLNVRFGVRVSSRSTMLRYVLPLPIIPVVDEYNGLAVPHFFNRCRRLGGMTTVNQVAQISLRVGLFCNLTWMGFMIIPVKRSKIVQLFNSQYFDITVNNYINTEIIYLVPKRHIRAKSLQKPKVENLTVFLVKIGYMG